MNKIIVAGHICLDITPTYKGHEVKEVSEILRPGKLINTGVCDMHTGGVVANTGLAIKLLGGEPVLACKVGDDEFGKIVAERLEAYGVEADVVVSKNEATSYSVVLNFPGIDRMFLHNPGVNDSFCSQDLSDRLFEKGSHFHFGYPPIMRKMYTGSGAHLAVILKRAIKAGLTTSVDMAAIDPNSAAGKVNWPRILSNILPYVDFFTPSFEELCFMLDPKKLEARIIQAEKDNVDITSILNVEDDVRPLAEECLKLGAKVVVIKCGELGVYYESVGRSEIRPLCEKKSLNIDEWGKKRGFIRSYIPEKIVSGTGAGDTAIAAFLLAMSRGYSLKKCVKLAAACGSMCMTGIDALSGLVSLDSLICRIEEGWEQAIEEENNRIIRLGQS